MSNIKKNIKYILKEEEKKYLHDRGANAILKLRYGLIYDYALEQYGAEWMEENKWPGTFDHYINKIKNDFPDQDSTMELSRICDTKRNPLVEGTGEEYCLRIVSNYILNYGIEDKVHYDVIQVDDFGQFLEDNFFNCNDQFFEFVWDDVLSNKRNRWGESMKEKMWEEILPEVEEKMEEEDEEEDNIVGFESLDNEKMYFLSYWHYPLQSLGWTNETLCEWYVDTIGKFTLNDILTKEKLSDFAKIVGIKNTYYIFKKKLFY
jgi:hypothetical protein